MLRQRQLTFIGKVLDGYTHTIPHYLAAIRESTGRLGDLLGEASQLSEEDLETFTNILSTIDRQVKMLAGKSQHLSRFSQRIGTASSTFDPWEIIEEAVSFSTRAAHVREISLLPEATETLPNLYSDPARVHFLVSILIDDMLERVGSGGKIVLRAGSAEKGVLIEVEGHSTSEAPAPPPEEGKRYWPIGQQVVADLGGRLQTTATQGDTTRSSLFLPSVHP